MAHLKYRRTVKVGREPIRMYDMICGHHVVANGYATPVGSGWAVITYAGEDKRERIGRAINLPSIESAERQLRMKATSLRCGRS